LFIADFANILDDTFDLVIPITTNLDYIPNFVHIALLANVDNLEIERIYTLYGVQSLLGTNTLTANVIGQILTPPQIIPLSTSSVVTPLLYPTFSLNSDNYNKN
jgi:hypothetical protein